jgi:hypothetical protein
MKGFRLIWDRIVEISRRWNGTIVSEDRGQIVEIFRGQPRGIVRLVETKRLITPLIYTVSQQVDSSMFPAPFELIQIQA